MDNDTTVTAEQTARPTRKNAASADPVELTMNHKEEACCSFTGITANKSAEKILFREGPFLISAEAIDALTNQLAKYRAQKRGS